MQLSLNQLEILCEIAEKTAKHAANLILSAYQKEILVITEFKDSGTSLASQVLTQTDMASDRLIREALKESCERCDIALLTEECEDDQRRFEKDYFWCVDPLDGTLPFIEKRSGFAVSIALVSQSGRPVLGVVCNPVSGNVYSAIKGGGLKKNGQVWQPGGLSSDVPLASNFYLSCDQSFKSWENYTDIVRSIDAWALQRGYQALVINEPAGAVMNACNLLEKGPGAYFKLPKSKLGGGSVWDFAATDLLYQETSAFVSDAHGALLNLNPTDTTFMNRSGVVYVSDQKVGIDLLAEIQTFL